jgi:hypothetical protein
VNWETHHIPADAAVNGRQRQAACGIWVRSEQHHEPPSCPACQAYLTDEAVAADLTIEDLFGESDPSLNVKPSFAANAASNREGYRPRGERR